MFSIYLRFERHGAEKILTRDYSWTLLDEKRWKRILFRMQSIAKITCSLSIFWDSLRLRQNALFMLSTWMSMFLIGHTKLKSPITNTLFLFWLLGVKFLSMSRWMRKTHALQTSSKTFQIKNFHQHFIYEMFLIRKRLCIIYRTYYIRRICI